MILGIYYSKYVYVHHQFPPPTLRNIYSLAQYSEDPNTIQALHSQYIYSISNIYIYIYIYIYICIYLITTFRVWTIQTPGGGLFETLQSFPSNDQQNK